MNRLPILQSGFVAAAETALQRPGDQRDPFMDYTLNKEHLGNNNQNFFLPEINHLYEEYKGNPKVIHNADWIIRLIRAAKEGFGTNLRNWMVLQDNKPTVGTYHSDFLLDTMQYLMTGKRRMTMHNWYRLLGLPVTSGNAGVGKAVKLFTRVGRKDERPYADSDVPSRIEMVITAWLSKEDGLLDLMHTTFLVFGRRVTVDTVEAKHG